MADVTTTSELFVDVVGADFDVEPSWPELKIGDYQTLGNGQILIGDGTTTTRTAYQSVQRDQRAQEEYMGEWPGWLSVVVMLAVVLALAWRELRR